MSSSLTIGTMNEFSIKGSVAKLLSPRYEIRDQDDGSALLLLWIDVPDATSENRFDGLPSMHPLTRYQVDRCRRDSRFMANTVRTAIIRAFEHELDESLFVDDQQLFAPKHWGPEEIVFSPV